MASPSPRLELRQGQSLVMTQQLQQSIKMLQLTSQELVEYIDQELEKNPLLTLEDAGQKEEGREAEEHGDGEDGEEREPEVAEAGQEPEEGRWEGSDDADGGHEEAGPAIEDTYRIRIHSQGEESDAGER